MSTDPELALFPLPMVLFPDGLLCLKVFEARYLDLIAQCLRERQSFGVVLLRSATAGGRTGSAAASTAAAPDLEATGTRAELIDVDADQTGILLVRCRGTQRFAIRSRRQRKDGLWLALTEPLPDDEAVAPPYALVDSARGLAAAVNRLDARNERPFLEPYRFDDAGWVANRWCEILPISARAKHKLMELPDPLVRLQLVDEYLRKKGVVD